MKFLNIYSHLAAVLLSMIFTSVFLIGGVAYPAGKARKCSRLAAGSEGTGVSSSEEWIALFHKTMESKGLSALNIPVPARFAVQAVEKEKAEYLDKLLRLQTAIAKEFPNSPNSKVVLNPASGNDGATFFQIVNSTLVVGIDDHPFFMKDRQDPTDVRNEEESLRETLSFYGREFEHFRNLDEEGHMAPGIIGSILSANPGRKILSITTYYDPSQIVDVDEKGFFQASHGIVRFITPPSQVVQTYVHINRVLDDSWTLDPTIAALNFDVLAVKSAMNLFAKAESRQLLLQKVIHGGKLVIEGDNYNGRAEAPSKNDGSWEFLRQSKLAHEKIFSNVPFGYNNRLRVSSPE